MSINQINIIAPALDLLSQNLDHVMPAVGGAMEDLEHPDVEELDDILINAESREITSFLETPTPDVYNLYRETPPIFREENNFYRFFIDGSIRTYYLATGIEGTRTFPIELAQIGAAVIERDKKGNVHPLEVKHRLLLLLPKGAFGVSDTVWAELKKLNRVDRFFEVIDTTEKNAFAPQ